MITQLIYARGESQRGQTHAQHTVQLSHSFMSFSINKFTFHRYPLRTFKTFRAQYLGIISDNLLLRKDTVGNLGMNISNAFVRA